MNVQAKGARLRRRRTWMVSGIAAAVMVLAACSGGGSDDGSDGGSDTTSAGGKSVVTDAMGPVTKADAPTASFKPPTGKRVLVLSCGNTGQGCVNQAKETQRVAESLGWKVDLVDGKLDPTVWNQVVKQSVESGIDGIISVSADPNLMTDAMKAVQAKDVPFVLTYQAPQDDDIAGIDSYVAPDPVQGGKDLAEWITADSGGKADILVLDLPGYYSASTRAQTIISQLGDTCDGCTVRKADIAVQTMGTSLAPLVTAQLQQHPDVDYVFVPSDCCASFVTQGIQQAGKSANVKVVSADGYPDSFKSLKTGEIGADQAAPALYMSWLSVDSLGRLMAGEPAEKVWTVPQRIFTKENIGDAPKTAETAGWNPDFDYEGMFKTLWGVK